MVALGVVVVAALYLAREVLIPITLAILLSFVLGPVVSWFRGLHLPKVPAVLLAVILALCIIATLGSVIGVQIASLAPDLPRYASTVGQKINAVQGFAVPADAIQRQLALGRHNLLVVGVSPRSGDALFFGQVAAELLDKAPCSLLMVASEPFVSPADRDSKPEEITTPVQRAA
jgi:nucleotide-binding universal stress UspA family protein